MTKFSTTRALGLTLAAVAALAAAAPAFAQTYEEVISIRVSYADLDISHASGAKILLKRIETASVHACGGAPDVHTLDARTEFDRCRQAAVNQAVTQIDSPLLTAFADLAPQSMRLASR